MLKQNEVQERYWNIKKQIEKACLECQRDPSSVQLLAVSKKQSIEKIKSLLDVGHTLFGENYVQEAMSKQILLSESSLSWHFIGTLQRNKVKDVVGHFEIIHSVDSMELATKISQKASEMGIHQTILLELNVAHEASKSGFSQKELEKQFESLLELPHLTLAGLMLLPPPVENPELIRPYFKASHEIFQRLSHQIPEDRKKDWNVLSMGTTQDFTVAIQEGASMVRVGTAIFGERE